MSKLVGGVLAVTGFLACPCHLPITLPLLVGVLGGTGLGSFIAGHTGLVYGILGGYFILGLSIGVSLWYQKVKSPEGPACDLRAESGFLERKHGPGGLSRAKGA